MNGYLKIKTKIDNSELDKEITALENKIKKMQSEIARNDEEQSHLQAEIEKYEKLCKEADEYRHSIKKLEQARKNMVKANPSLAVSRDSMSPDYTNIVSQLDIVRQKYANATSELDKQAPKLDKIYVKLDKIKATQAGNNTKLAEYKQKLEQININKIQKGLDSVGRNIQSQISQLGKMAMAIVGIRTAWYAVRAATNLVKQYNEQVASDFQYMGFCIANIVAPAIQQLIKLLYTLLGYVNALSVAWFGVNLFANSSAQAFESMQNGANRTSKAAKEIKKSLQGFDEMNVLQDNSSSANSNSGTVAPSVDLSQIQSNIPSWLQWIIDNKDIVIQALLGIAGGILAVKLGLTGIQALGIGLLIAEIVKLVQDIITFIKDPSFDNFLNILIDIALVVGTIAVLFSLWPALIAAIIVLIVAIIIKNWDKIKEILRAGWYMDIRQCDNANLEFYKKCN